ncbi:MAG: methyl-accepting chemotaxis protein [Rhodobacteraceae bacterium]|nr:methyl-accepting chemotaxis protein [Paracoccaceae bacterium]
MADQTVLSVAEQKALKMALSDLRNAQGFALNAAAIFFEVVTACGPEHRADVAQQFRTFQQLYSKTIRTAAKADALVRGDAKVKALIGTAMEIETRLNALDASDNFANALPTEAGELVQFVRLQGVPAIMRLCSTLGGAKKLHDKAVEAVMKERLAKLDKMFTEVEDIGRMIHLISLNASVEAARAGGESGRSFKVIADEIRGLAQQAATLIDTTRAGVLPGAETDLLGVVNR